MKNTFPPATFVDILAERASKFLLLSNCSISRRDHQLLVLFKCGCEALHDTSVTNILYNLS